MNPTVAAAGVVAFLFSAVLGGRIIPLLGRAGARQTVSGDAPATHRAKQGTPTMGGLMIVAGLAVPVAVDAWARPYHRGALGLLALTAAMCAIGFLDDYLIARRGKNLGLKAREKLLLQLVAATAWVYWLGATSVNRVTEARVTPTIAVDLGGWYFPLAVLFIVGFANAVNFLDGLDGQAAGVCAILALGLSAMVFSAEPYAWLPLFTCALAGACLGFLWHNVHPAAVFMGDTGSLALGGALAGAAIMGKVEFPFQVCAVVPWAELLSVVVQVAVFQTLRRRRGLEYAKAHRVFRRTPLHHHFEEGSGWPETRIVGRFCLVTAAATGAVLAWVWVPW